MKQKLITLALFGAITLPLAAYAETASLDEMVVTAARLPQSLKQTIAHTTVLNEQAIRQSGASDVPTLLRLLAGVEVAQSGGLGNISSTFMRGTNSSHVLVLLDGVRINSATAGKTALEHIMLDSIERIEVVRGNVSSLYGSEAIGGVIQLFTKRGHGAPAFNVSTGLGSHGTQLLAVGFAGEVNDTSFNVNVGKVKTNGVSAINTLLAPGANPNNNGYDNNTLNTQVSHTINGDHILTATLFSTRGNSSFDATGFGTLSTDVNDALANIDKLSLASENQLGENWHSTVRLAQGTDDSRRYTNGIQTSRFKTRSNQLVWQNDIKLADHQHLTLAAEHLGQEVSSDTLFTQNSRKVNSLLAGYVGDYGLHQVQLNVRQDRYSDFGIADTGLLGYGLQFTDALRLTASLSSAFKAPTFNDLYYPPTWGFAGNPNLKPEHSQNKELGLRYAADGQRFDAVYFDNRIRDLIAVNNTFTSMTNVGEARMDGIELSYAGDFGNSHLQANATFQNPRNAATGQVLLRRAKEFANISASHDFDILNMGVELHHSGARADGDINTFAPVAVASYQVVNLTAQYKVDKNLAVSARMDNLLNRDYMQVHGYNTPGRILFVGLSYQQ